MHARKPPADALLMRVSGVLIVVDSELDVAAKGKPYPVRISNKGESGALTFSGWGQTQPINTPPSPLDLNNISS